MCCARAVSRVLLFACACARARAHQRNQPPKKQQRRAPHQYCEGGDLFKTMLMRGGALPEQWVAAEVLAPLLRVLEQMHGLGLLHRDIKVTSV